MGVRGDTEKRGDAGLDDVDKREVGEPGPSVMIARRFSDFLLHFRPREYQ